MEFFPRKYLTRSDIEYRIRSARKEDSESIKGFLQSAIANSEYLEFNKDDFGHSTEHESQIIQKCHEAENCIMLLAENSEGIIGFASIRVSSKGLMSDVGVFGIVIHQAYRGQRVGAVLMNEILQCARKSKLLKKIILAVHEENGIAIRMYEKAGFVGEGILEHEPDAYGISQHQIVMGLDLAAFE
jgi:ribosomal protein S18 acetylase RimI-like enzyme